jgi:ATP-dependent DNA helicase RecQ
MFFFNDVWQSRVSCIVFDEAHCLSEWGEDFRPEYREMAQLRSFFKVPILAITATSTKKVKDDIISILQLKTEETDIVSKSPDRQNIILSCFKKQQKPYEDDLSFLVDHIKSNGKNSKKIIIYCRSIDVVAEVFISLKEALNKNAYVDGILNSSNILIEMYHKCTHEISKSRIMKDFSKPDSVIRCLVATVALGMGIDIPDIDMVIHIGCPKSVISYWQEAGRCARDGRCGLSLIMYDNFTASLKSTDKSMAEIVKNSEERCIRKMVLGKFDVIDTDFSELSVCSGCNEAKCVCTSCNCCSTCAKKCPCADRSVSSVTNFLAYNNSCD